MTTRKPPTRCHRRLAAGPLALLVAVLSACSTAAPRQTGFQQMLGSEMSSREIRIRTTQHLTACERCTIIGDIECANMPRLVRAVAEA